MTLKSAIKKADESKENHGIQFAVVRWGKEYAVITLFSAKKNGLHMEYLTDY